MLKAWRRLFSCLPLAAALVSSAAGAQPIALSLDAIEHPAFSARQIALQLDGLSGGSADLDIGRLAAAGRVLSHVRLHCGEFRWSPQRVECRHGELRPAGVAALPMEFVYVPQQRHYCRNSPHGIRAAVSRQASSSMRRTPMWLCSCTRRLSPTAQAGSLARKLLSRSMPHCNVRGARGIGRRSWIGRRVRRISHRYTVRAACSLPPPDAMRRNC